MSNDVTELHVLKGELN